MSKEKTAEWTYELIEHLRLLLLGQLVKITGVIWFIDYDVSRWDLKFDCRWGFGLREILSIGLHLEKSKEYIENRMNDQAWVIAKAYWKRKAKQDEIREPG